MGDRRWVRSFARSIVFLIQFGFSLVLPPLLCVAAAHWLQQRYQLGGWIWALAIGLGLLMAAGSFAEFVRHMQREAAQEPLTDWDTRSGSAEKRTLAGVVVPEKKTTHKEDLQ